MASRAIVVVGCVAEIRPIVPDTGNAETGNKEISYQAPFQT
jgi:hypothetical protein